jgi:prepilin-type N-terminal cleavage/methylation domain-containing protein
MRRETRHGNRSRSQSGKGFSAGFTLLEMMIAITVFSVVMIFLYKSLATLEKSNSFYGERLDQLTRVQRAVKTLYLDLSLSLPGKGQILPQEKSNDVVIMQTSNVMHQRFMPYVAYLVRNRHLYRVESPNMLRYPIDNDDALIVDDLGAVRTFRLYKSPTHFLLHLQLEGSDKLLMKIRHLNTAATVPTTASSESNNTQESPEE